MRCQVQRTNIEWTDFSSALLKYRDNEGKSVHACVKCSDGCRNCYAEGIANRFENRKYTLSMVKVVTPFFDESEAKKILRSRVLKNPSCKNHGKPSMIFTNDMTDLFGDWVSDSIIDWHFALFALRQDVTFQVLTKRPERAQKYFALLQSFAGKHAPKTVGGKFSPVQVLNFRAFSAAPNLPGGIFGSAISPSCKWPLPNAHIGVSVENQKAADERVPLLLKTPAAVRFLSCEPLLGALNLYGRLGPEVFSGSKVWGRGIDWVIVGGESGPGARPCRVEWIRSIIEQCKAAGVACFVKQLGSNAITWYQHADGLGGITGGGGDVRYLTEDKKGGDIEEWPNDLRVREFPK